MLQEAAFLSSPVGAILQLLNTFVPQPGVQLDVAQFPNPFRSPKLGGGAFIDSQEDYLGIVDGGLDGQVIPLQPLLVKARGVDVIFAIDAVSTVYFLRATGFVLMTS